MSNDSKPTYEQLESLCTTQGEAISRLIEGDTLRDRFAMAALGAIIRGNERGSSETPRDEAMRAYAYAEAMLAMRVKGAKPDADPIAAALADAAQQRIEGMKK